jgi:hypothetical protein
VSGFSVVILSAAKDLASKLFASVAAGGVTSSLRDLT